MLIGLTGYQRSGKDSVGKFLIPRYGFDRYYMAQPLKEALKIIFLWDEERIEERKDEVDPRWGISPRQAMRHLGTQWAQYELGAAYPLFAQVTDRKLWSNRFLMWYDDRPKSSSVVVTDVRFPHEADAVRSRGGYLVRVDRPGFNTDKDHESEQHIESLEVDFIIRNSSTLAVLHEKTEKLINLIQKVQLLGSKELGARV